MEILQKGQRVRVLVAIGEHPDKAALGLATVEEDGAGYVSVRSDSDGKLREIHTSRMIPVTGERAAPEPVPAPASAPSSARTFCEWCPKPYGHKGACLSAPDLAGRGDDGESYMVGGSGRRGGRGRE